MSAPARVRWLPVAVAVSLAAAAGAIWWWFSSRPVPVAPAPVPERKLGALGDPPKWNDLAVEWAGSLRVDELTGALDSIYAPGEAWNKAIELPAAVAGQPEPVASVIPWSLETSWPRVLVPLASGPDTPAVDAPRYWRPAASLPPAPDPARPLDGVKIALDPGHIGGRWARMEERWYQLPGNPTEVKEGELTLATARVLKPALESLGATVSLVRDALEPVTRARPEKFAQNILPLREAEKYFYRFAEIRARADLVNNRLRPDLVVCMHFNAESWGDPKQPTLVETNHLHLLVNGHYSAEELSFDDVRAEMLTRLFQRIHEEEIPLADAVARSLATASGLPPYDYAGGHMNASAHRVVPDNPFVWARNLLANRLYRCPVVFCEPYVMNSREVFERVVAGDYPGDQVVAGRLRKSIFREYAEGVADGLKRYFVGRRAASAAVVGETGAESR